MKSQHVDPEEAVQVHVDIKAKNSLAIHWGTFALAYEVRAHLSHMCKHMSFSASRRLCIASDFIYFEYIWYGEACRGGLDFAQDIFMYR